MSYSVHFAQHLTIGDVPLSTPAWEVTNIQALMSGPGIRGENRVIPGAAGIRPLRHRPTEKTVTLELVVFGNRDPAGVDHPDPETGLWANWLTLRNQFNDLLLNDGDSTTSAVLHYAGGTLVGDVQVLGYEVGDAIGPTAIYVTLDLNIVGGMLT